MSFITHEKSVGLCVRYYEGELPYIQSFLSHYRNIGINKFYILIPENDVFLHMNTDIILIKTKYSTDIELNNTINMALSYFKEDYILNVDCDEYLNIQCIHKYIHEYPADYYKFHWLININDMNNGMNNDMNNYVCNIPNMYKSMCKTSLIKSITTHDFILNIEISQINIHSDTNLIHYWCRSFNDLVIKIKYGKLKQWNIKIHSRIKMLALLKRCIEINKHSIVPKYFNINYVEENKLIDPFKDQISILYNEYQDYIPLIKQKDVDYYLSGKTTLINIIKKLN